MRVEYRTYERGQAIAGKITMVPETQEEQKALDDFRAHVGNSQRGRRHVVVYKWRAGPEEIASALRSAAEKEKGGGARDEG